MAKKRKVIKKRVLGNKIRLHNREIRPLDDYYVKNRDDLNRRIVKCHSCKFWYPANNFYKNRAPAYRHRFYRDTQCKSCKEVSKKQIYSDIPKATTEDYQKRAIEFWDKKYKERLEKYENKPRRIPKEYHKSKHYTKVKNKLNNIMNNGEEKELLKQIKDNYTELAEQIKEETGLEIIYDHDEAIKLLKDPLVIAKKVTKYINSTKANPNLTPEEREDKRIPHLELYGLAESIGIDVQQLKKIMNSHNTDSKTVMIRGIIRSAVNKMRSYTINLALDKNVTAKDTLKDFADTDNWNNNDDDGRDLIKLDNATVDNVLNYMIESQKQIGEDNELDKQIINIEEEKNTTLKND